MSLIDFFKLVRYRFFLFAGIFPYLLGAVAAYRQNHSLSLFYFFLGFLGMFLVFVGVETFNEYFDYKYGGDRIFSQNFKGIPDYILFVGIAAFALAFILAVYLTITRGILIFLFALLGFFAAAFYVGPPLRLVYHGWGELVIFLSYGPLMTIGSFYLLAQKLNGEIFLVSLIPGLLMFALSVANAIPDFYQDRLVGKRNLVVRLGQRKAVGLYQGALIFCGLLFFFFAYRHPLLLLFLPLFIFLSYRSVKQAENSYALPAQFLSVIRTTLLLYLTALSFLILIYLIS